MSNRLFKDYTEAEKYTQSLNNKISCRAATTGNITLSGTQTIDGISVAIGDRVLVKNQSTASENGIYVCYSGGWHRAPDMDTSIKCRASSYIFIEEGTSNANKLFQLTTDNDIILGTTDLTFAEYGVTSIIAGNGLKRSESNGDVIFALDLAELTESTVTPATDSIVFIDSTDDSSKKSSVVNFVSGIVTGDGLNTTNGQLSLDMLDEDNMASDSNTKVATQQSIKAYVDNELSTQDLDFQGDTGGIQSMVLDSNTLTLEGGTGIDTTGSTNKVSFSIDSTVATLTGSQTLTNKTLTSAVLNTGVSGSAILDEDDMNSNSSTQLATQQSIKAYVDNSLSAQDLDFQGDSGGAQSVLLDSQSLTLEGGTGIDTTGSTNKVSFAIDSTVATLTGSQTLTNKTLSGATLTNNPVFTDTSSGNNFILNLGANIQGSRTIALPQLTDNDTFVFEDHTQTLTNKTLTSAVLNTGVSGSAILDEDNMSSNSATQLATQQSIKAYVDSVASGLDVRGSCRVATTSNITLSNTQTIDGVSIVAGNRVLVKDQSTASDNGIYVCVDGGSWTRATDFNTDNEVTAGVFTFIEEGTTHANAGFVLTTNNDIILGTNDLSFTQFSGAGQITAGDGIAKSGNTLSIDAKVDSGIEIDTSELSLNLGATSIKGTLAVSNGGTGATTAAAARVALGITDVGSGEIITSAERIKLDGIEASADVTNTANVTAAGALMDSEVTDLAGIKGVTISTLQVKPSEGAFVDGDKTKLDGIEASADVTNTANVTAAGALMDSEVTNLSQVKSFDSSDYATAAQGSKADSAQQPPSEGAFVDGDKTKLDGIAESANNYSLPISASGTRGGVQVGYTENGKNYPVELLSEKMFVNVPWTDTTYSAGNGIGLSSNTFSVSAGDGLTQESSGLAITSAQTTITSLFATDIKIGEDDQTKIDFEDADKINFYAGNEKQLILEDGALYPGANNIIDLGKSDNEFKDAYFDGTVTSDAFLGPLTGNVTGNVSGSSGSCTGNAATATVLETARTIGGVSFNGSANINLPGVNSTGNQDTTGNADTATALETARTIHGVSFDGTGNIDLSEVIADTVGAMFSSNTETGITATYQDADNTIDLVVGTLNQDTTGNADTATLATTITASANNSTDETVYLTFVDGATGTQGIETDTGLTYNPSSGILTTTSVAGNLTGTVLTATQGTIDHDTLANFVANEHIDHSSVSVVAGDGLTGGGTIAANRTLAVGAGTGIDVAADAISVDVSDFMTNGANNRIVTATGTDAMNAEANLTFDGSALSLTGTFTVGVDDTGHDVKFFGATSGKYLLWDESEDRLQLSDNTKLSFGNGPDLEIYHDGSNSYIDDVGTGTIKYRSGTQTFTNATESKTMAIFNAANSVDLYYNNSKKFETTNTGVNITGTITGDTSLTLDSTTISTAEIGVLDGVTAGTATASKALVLDSNKDIGTIRNLTINGTFTDGNYTFDTSGNVSGLGTVGCGAITSSGNLAVTGTITGDTSLTLDSTTISTAEIGVLDGVTAGTATASKALVLDSSKDIGTVRNLLVNGKIGTATNQEFINFGTSDSIIFGIDNSNLVTMNASGLSCTGDLTVDGHIYGPGVITYQKVVTPANVANFTLTTTYKEIDQDLRMKYTPKRSTISLYLTLYRVRPNYKILSYEIYDWNAGSAHSGHTNKEFMYSQKGQNTVKLKHTMFNLNVDQEYYFAFRIKANANSGYIHLSNLGDLSTWIVEHESGSSNSGFGAVKDSGDTSSGGGGGGGSG